MDALIDKIKLTNLKSEIRNMLETDFNAIILTYYNMLAGNNFDLVLEPINGLDFYSKKYIYDYLSTNGIDIIMLKIGNVVDTDLLNSIFDYYLEMNDT
jgi:hypothetical protein